MSKSRKLLKLLLVVYITSMLLLFVFLVGTTEESQYLVSTKKVVGINIKNCSEIFNSHSVQPNNSIKKKFLNFYLISQSIPPMHLLQISEHKTVPIYIWFHGGSFISVFLQNVFLLIEFSHFGSTIFPVILLILLALLCYLIYPSIFTVFLVFSITSFISQFTLASGFIYFPSVVSLVFSLYLFKKQKYIASGFFFFLSSVNYLKLGLTSFFSFLILSLYMRRIKPIFIFIVFLILSFIPAGVFWYKFYDVDKPLLSYTFRKDDISFFRKLPRTAFPFFYNGIKNFRRENVNIFTKLSKSIRDLAGLLDFRGPGDHLGIKNDISPSPIPIIISSIFIISVLLNSRRYMWIFIFMISFFFIESLSISTENSPRRFFPILPLIIIFIAKSFEKKKMRPLILIFLILQFINTSRILYNMWNEKNFFYYTPLKTQNKLAEYIKGKEAGEFVNLSALVSFPLLAGENYSDIKDYSYAILWDNLTNLGRETLICILKANRGKYAITSFLKSAEEINKIIDGSSVYLKKIATFPTKKPLFEISIIEEKK